MNRELDRRTVLKAGLATVGSLFLSPEVRADHETSEDITLEQSLAFAKRFDRLKDRLSPEWEVNIQTQEQMNNWIQEIVPFFEYEGITDPKQDVGEMGGLVYPEIAEFDYYEDGLRHNHVLGTTQIFGDEMDLNARYSNPVSPFYERGDSLSTLIHELAHIQGIKSDGTRVNSESSAQLATLEIMSAMFLRGNEKVLDNLLDDLRYMFYASAKYIGIRDGREQEVLDARDDIFPNEYDQAQMDKSDRFWKDDPDRLYEILHDYNYTPVTEVFKSLESGKDAIDGVYLPINWLANFANMPSYYPGMDQQTEPSEPMPTKPLVIDDLAYFIRNAEPIIDSILYGEITSN